VAFEVDAHCKVNGLIDHLFVQAHFFFQYDLCLSSLSGLACDGSIYSHAIEGLLILGLNAAVMPDNNGALHLYRFLSFGICSR
jgi:hypothetical protein